MNGSSAAKWTALGGFLLQAAAAMAAMVTGMATGIPACLVIAGFLAATTVTWACAGLHVRQRALAEEEARRLEEEKRKRGGALFEEGDLFARQAQLTLNRMEKYLFPVLSLSSAAALAGVCFLAYVHRDAAGAAAVDENFLVTAAVSFVTAAALLFLGMYVRGMGELNAWKPLRAGANSMLAGAVGLFAVSAVVLLVHFSGSVLPHVVLYAGAAAVCGLTAADLLLSMIGGLFVPRMPGAVPLPAYHSRFLEIITNPGGIMQTVAHFVDYQFGFKVSETWFYSFLQRAFIPLGLFWAFTLLAFSCIVVLKPEERGIIERFGRPHGGVIGAGLHFKLPWPIDKVYVLPANRVHTISVGYRGEIEDQPAILWTVAHYKQEDMFVVATREKKRTAVAKNKHAGGEKRRYVPVSLVSLLVKVYYTVGEKPEDVTNYLYRFSDPDAFLKDLVYREVVRFLVSVDVQELFKWKKLEFADFLEKRIQEIADRHQLGIRVLHVGLENAHPPVKVADAYESVITALEEQHATVLRADSYKRKASHQAEAEAYETLSEAKAYNHARTVLSKADADAFAAYRKAFTASPRVYRIRKYLDTLEEGLKGRRKYVVPAGMRGNVLFDLKDKLEFTIQELDIGGAKTTKEGNR